MTACVSGKPQADTSEAGLRLIADDRIDELYLADNADLSSYSSLYVEELEVELDRSWLRQQNTNTVSRIRPQDQKRIIERIRKVFEEEFLTRILEENGYEKAEGPAPNTLIMKPAIVNLRINAPDLMEPYSVTKLAEDAGSGRLKLELLDAESGQRLLKMEDYQRARGYGRTLRRQTAVENRQEAARMMRRWADAVNDIIKPVTS